jgi:hypothetical protein
MIKTELEQRVDTPHLIRHSAVEPRARDAAIDRREHDAIEHVRRREPPLERLAFVQAKRARDVMSNDDVPGPRIELRPRAPTAERWRRERRWVAMSPDRSARSTPVSEAARRRSRCRHHGGVEGRQRIPLPALNRAVSVQS